MILVAGPGLALTFAIDCVLISEGVKKGQQCSIHISSSGTNANLLVCADVNDVKILMTPDEVTAVGMW